MSTTTVVAISRSSAAYKTAFRALAKAGYDPADMAEAEPEMILELAKLLPAPPMNAQDNPAIAESLRELTPTPSAPKATPAPTPSAPPVDAPSMAWTKERLYQWGVERRVAVTRKMKKDELFRTVSASVPTLRMSKAERADVLASAGIAVKKTAKATEIAALHQAVRAGQTPMFSPALQRGGRTKDNLKEWLGRCSCSKASLNAQSKVMFGGKTMSALNLGQLETLLEWVKAQVDPVQGKPMFSFRAA